MFLLFPSPQTPSPPRGPGSRLFGLLSGRRSRDRSPDGFSASLGSLGFDGSEIPRPTTGGMHETLYNHGIFDISHINW